MTDSFETFTITTPMTRLTFIPTEDLARRVRYIIILGFVALFGIIGVIAFAFLNLMLPQESLPPTEVALPVLLILVLVSAIAIIMMMVLMFHDLKDTRDSQRKMRDLVYQYQRRTIQLQVAAATAREASSAADLDAILNTTTQLVRERFHYYHVAIFIIQEDEDGTYAEMKSVAGEYGSRELLASGHRLRLDEMSMVGNVARIGQLDFAHDVRKHPLHRPNPLMPNTRSELSVPMRVGERVIGVLDVQANETNGFAQDDFITLQTLSDLIAVAIDKAHLHQTVQDYAALLETRVKERTQALAQERAQLSAILEAMYEGVLYEEGAEVKYVNTAFTNLLGYDATEWDGMLPILYADDVTEEDVQNQYETMHLQMSEDHMWQGETRLKHRNGHDLYAAVTLVRVPKTGAMTHCGTVTVVRDISNERALDEQRRRFVAYASHELRTPLTNIKTRLYLLRKKPDLLTTHLDILDNVVERMQRLVNDLLEQSRFERGLISLRRNIIPVQDVITTVYNEQLYEAQNKQITLTVKQPNRPLHVDGDHQRLAQVLTNLVSNAINYTDSGGAVTIQVKQASIRSLHIDVIDTGVGIPKDVIGQVFQPFFRAENVEAAGTGLGLNISQHIVHLHDGEIDVRSVLHEGTTFTVTLPLVTIQPEAAASAV